MFIPLFESESHKINVSRKVRIFGYMTEQELYGKIDLWIGSGYEDWNHITHMAYFLKKYKETYGVKFSLAAYKGNPAKTKECRDFSNLIKKFRSDSYDFKTKEEKKKEDTVVNKKIYNYVNWVFDKKFNNTESTITGTRIFLAYNLINEFEAKYRRSQEKNKDQGKLDAFFKKALKVFPELSDSYNLKTKDDLKIIEQTISFYNLGANSAEAKVVKAARKAKLL
jgi:hypothetical protein